MGAITAADAVVILQVTGVSLAPTQIQGFGTDDVFDVPAIQSAETMMGVDGILSAGFVYVEIPWNFTLQADSDSNNFFDTWWTQMQASKSTFSASGTIIVPAIGTKWNLINGFLKSYKPAPDAKRLLQVRKYGITWNSILPAPTGD